MKDLLKDFESINNHFREIGKIEGRREALIESGEFREESPISKLEDFLMSIPIDSKNSQEILRELHEKISILLLNTTVELKERPNLRILDDDCSL